MRRGTTSVRCQKLLRRALGTSTQPVRTALIIAVTHKVNRSRLALQLPRLSEELLNSVRIDRRDEFPEGIAVKSTKSLRRLSKLVHAIGEITSRSSVTTVVAVAVLASLVALIVTGFPQAGTEAFATSVSAVTVVMLFVIQHTQSREQSATQLKLDELIRATPAADDLLVHIESAEEVELIERESEQIAHHVLLREDDIVPDNEAAEVTLDS